MAELDYKQGKEQLGNYEPIPAGKYIAVIDSSEKKETKSGTGAYLNLVFKIVDGEFEGKKVFQMVHLWNANPTAVQIAQKTLNTIMACLGIETISDSAELHLQPLVIKVIVKDDAEYGPKNEIKGFEPVGGVKAEKPINLNGETKKQTSGSKKPWEQ